MAAVIIMNTEEIMSMKNRKIVYLLIYLYNFFNFIYVHFIYYSAYVKGKQNTKLTI